MRLKLPMDDSDRPMPKTLLAGLIICSFIVLSACGKDRSSNNQIFAQSIAGVQSELNNSTYNSQISGTAHYERVGKNQLYQYDYYNTSNHPIRWALVEAIDAEKGTVLSTAVTDQEGYFELSVPDTSAVVVRVISRALDENNPAWHLSVEDNTNEYRNYAISSAVIHGSQHSEPLQLNAPTGWEDGQYTEERQAAPFAILDTLLDGYLFLANSQMADNLAPLSAAWSASNLATIGDVEQGEIESTHFSDHSLSPTIYVLGHVHNDADEYDRAILLHEFAHYALSAFTRADTVGGAHDKSSKLDLRVAFNEAMANVMAAIINESPIFTDVYGSQQVLVNRLNLEMDAQDYQGWYSVIALSQLLYDLYDDRNENIDTVSLGWEGFLKVLTHEDFLSFDGASSIYSFLSVAKTLYPEFSAGINTLAETRDINSSDAYGHGETNDGGARVSLPLHTELSVNQAEIVCSDSDFRDFNGLDVHRLLTFNIPSSGVYTVRAKKINAGLDITNPEFGIYQAGELKLAGLSTKDNIEEVAFSFVPGNYLLDVYERNNADNDELTGGSACFEIQLLPGDLVSTSRSKPASSHCDSLATFASEPNCEFHETSRHGMEFKSQHRH